MEIDNKELNKIKKNLELMVHFLSEASKQANPMQRMGVNKIIKDTNNSIKYIESLQNA